MQVIVSQLGQDEPHTVNIADGQPIYSQNHPYKCSAVLFDSFLMRHTVSRADLRIDSMFVLKGF